MRSRLLICATILAAIALPSASAAAIALPSASAAAIALPLASAAAAASVSASASASASSPIAAPTSTPVPYGFVGMVANGPLLEPEDHVNLAHQLDVMVASGVDSVRVVFDWAAAQPVTSSDQIPPDLTKSFVAVGGISTNFTAIDQIVGLAADRRMTVLPVVLYAPPWDAAVNHQGISIPKRPGPYAAFLTALVQRYGPRGTFWGGRSGPRLPIRAWQIWNEPNLAYNWPQPFAAGYVKLLSAAHKAIKQADPGAKVVLGALTNFAWKSLREIQKIRGAKDLFDVLSVNGFTATPDRVIEYLNLFRRAANKIGDQSKPLLATEVSWPSSKGKTREHFTWNTTEAGQARNIKALLPMLAAQRQQLGLAGFYYYTWVGVEFTGASSFAFSGLFRFRTDGQFVAKPAFNAFKTGALAIEGCRTKARIATRCAERR